MKIPKIWTFRDDDVARGFDEHVREQLPWYELVTAAAQHIARSYLHDRARAYEIGASTGNFAKGIADVIAARRVRYTAIEASGLMAARYDGPGDLVCADARDVRFRPFDLGVSFLCLTFVPRADRGPLLRRWFRSLRDGGALVLVEKFEPAGGAAGSVLHRLSIAIKSGAGVNPSAIVDKELSLAGAHFPLAARELALPSSAPQQFFRFGDFEGWLIEKRL